MEQVKAIRDVDKTGMAASATARVGGYRWVVLGLIFVPLTWPFLLGSVLLGLIACAAGVTVGR